MFEELTDLGADVRAGALRVGRQSDRVLQQRSREDHRRRRRDGDDPERKLVRQQHPVQRGRRSGRWRVHAGNRDMGLAVHSPELAGFFAELVARDMRLAQGLPPERCRRQAVLPRRRRQCAGRRNLLRGGAAGDSRTLFTSLTVTPCAPVRDHAGDHAGKLSRRRSKLLRSATTSLRIEQQYIRGGQPAIEELLRGHRCRPHRQSRASRADHRVAEVPDRRQVGRTSSTRWIASGSSSIEQLAIPVGEALRPLPQQADRGRRREGPAGIAELVDHRA